MKYIYCKLSLLIFIFFFATSCQEEIIDADSVESFEINSSYSNEDYNIQVYYPENYDSTIAYQTIFLLDGDWYFDELTEIIKEQYSNEIVLVGIGYKNDNNRNSDFTYPEDDILANSGNAKKYIQFLNNELIPYVNNTLQIKTKQKTLAGHSLGGYFSLYLIFQDEFNNPFDNIISASPSLFWHDAYLLSLEQQYSLSTDSLNVNLFITMGDSEGVTMNTLFNAFNKKIETRDYNGLTFSYERFENTTHNNNPIKSFETGISQLTK